MRVRWAGVNAMAGGAWGAVEEGLGGRAAGGRPSAHRWAGAWWALATKGGLAASSHRAFLPSQVVEEAQEAWARSCRCCPRRLDNGLSGCRG